MLSIYEFWGTLLSKKARLKKTAGLGEFPYERKVLSYAKTGRGFPNLCVRIDKENLTGGELIKIKDRNDYLIAPFKSSIPTGKKKIRDVIPSQNSVIFKQMQEAGDDVYSLEERDVYYLVRGRRRGSQKICLVHGSFFETVKADELIRDSFAQILDEELTGSDISEEVKDKLKSAFSRQESFSRVRNVEKASVRLRFRIMTEVKQEGNILNSSRYPEIEDDTLNLVVPYHSGEEKAAIHKNIQTVFDEARRKKTRSFSIKHPLNGHFIVYQVGL
jgi:hypothetical protein